MKLADRTVETHSRGVVSESQFTISQNAKMFKILSDSLYSDKIMAVIRELSTNANDSHISAHNEDPFKVTLPTNANPSFTIRDFGTGLSQKDMENLYTTYGASSKNDSNDFTGCLGLGSKSPFAYTKCFSATSYFNGDQYTYIASIDETGVPTLNLLSSNKTSEPNGIEISFAVKTYDFNEFQEKAKRVFHYFKNKPTVLGGDSTFKNHAYSSNNVVLSGNGWKVCKLSTDGDHFPSINRHIKDGIVAIMGNIAYPVDYNQFSGQGKQEEVPDHVQKWNRAFNKADIDGWKNFLSEILNANLYLELEFKIGDLEMDVSREGLQYTKDVIKVLRKTTKEIYADLRDQFSSKIAAAKTIVEATSMYYTLSSLGGSWGTGAEWVDGDGKTHSITGGTDISVKVEANKSLYVFNYRTTGYRGKRKIMQTDKIHCDTLAGSSSRDYHYRYYSSSTNITGTPVLFQCDIKSSEIAKKVVLAYCNEHKLYAYLMIDTKDCTKSTDGFVELIKAFGESNLLKVSDYKHLVKQTSRKIGTRTSAGSVSNQDVFLLYGNIPDAKALANNQYGEARYLKTLPQDSLDSFLDQEVIVYVPIVRYSAGVGFSSLGIIHDSIHSTSKILPELLDNHVYAIKESYVAKLKSKGYNLIDINDLLADCLARKYAKDFVKINDALALALNLGNGCDHHNTNKTLVDQVFLFGILNIFGLEYKEMIKNPEIVSCIDQLMLWGFFSREAFDYKPDNSSFTIKAFQKQDYFFLITSLLKDMGLDITSELLSRKIRELKKLQTTVQSLYNFDENTLQKYMSLITPKPKASIKLGDMKKIQQTIEIELDKNPMLKYTIAVGYESSKVDIRDISNISPQLSMLRYTYDMATSQKCWMYKMTQKQRDLLKTQLGSVIS